MRYTWFQLETWFVWSLKLLKTLWSRCCNTAWKRELLSDAGWTLQYIMIRLGAFWWVSWFSDGAYVKRVLKSPPETDTLHRVRTQFCISKVEQHAEIDSFSNASRTLATSHLDEVGERFRGAPFGPASQAWENKTWSCCMSESSHPQCCLMWLPCKSLCSLKTLLEYPDYGCVASKYKIQIHTPSLTWDSCTTDMCN